MAKSREKFKTMHNVFDEFTNQNIFRLMSQGHIDGLQSPISIGKEANIFSAKKSESKVIVKIYRLETCDFNRMFDYIKDDPRYLDLAGKKRKIIFAWVQREYRNLLLARQAGVRVPTPYTFMHNIIVMELIGDKYMAQKLKDSPPKNPATFLDDIIENMAKLYRAGLVHADLSPFNILNYDEKPFFIDFSQCTSIKTSRANEFLDRDIKNVANFFKKLGVSVNLANVKERIINQ